MSDFHCATDGSILNLAASSRGVAAQLTRDRPRVTTNRPGDLTNSLTLGAEQSDLLALSEAEVSTRGLRLDIKRRHAPSVAEPTSTDGLSYSGNAGGFLGEETHGDLGPERRFDMTLELRVTR